ncbi:two-component system, OmpR family, response regulator PhoP [Oceanospirillum multiglobuliferum]|uniref:DNA-binding response regulator n=1 Tax=Oceanospirillum multiglobuliferum TaxID=64969 RepID=A0A1T4PF48_9GAMM|nr:response regulator transcription factor [Oceanospirillum multiglobuliferum]OPX55584.1 DNA-binding response regulator [Oceanospirillum multiglobuliferum]SJZ89981.1 two-component system, OmpR family, response regulator PhoP [Oceanospirillum multiglobuliferum]
MKILIIEDDLELQRQLAENLVLEQYEVDISSDGDDGLYRAREYEYDMAIIDIGLPKISGLEVIKSLRSENNTLPILILTARSSWRDKVQGLKAGADDYLVKPFEIEELLARVEAILRRASGYSSHIIQHGAIKLDTQTQELWVNDEEIDLTAFEYKLLDYFLRNSKRIISKAALMDCLYNDDNDRDMNVLEVLIGRLRRKLDPTNTIKPIETLRGRGYRFSIKSEL